LEETAPRSGKCTGGNATTQKKFKKGKKAERNRFHPWGREAKTGGASSTSRSLKGTRNGLIPSKISEKTPKRRRRKKKYWGKSGRGGSRRGKIAKRKMDPTLKSGKPLGKERAFGDLPDESMGKRTPLDGGGGGKGGKATLGQPEKIADPKCP